MSTTDIVDRLTDLTGPLVDATNEIIMLRGRLREANEARAAAQQETAEATRAREHSEQLYAGVAAENAEVRQQLADLVAGGSDGAPDLPKPRKLWGVATTLDDEPVIYTEDQMRQAINRAYASGRVRGAREVRERHGIIEQPGPRSQEEGDKHAARRHALRGGGARG